jgi:hypothetical protein
LSVAFPPHVFVHSLTITDFAPCFAIFAVPCKLRSTLGRALGVAHAAAFVAGNTI